MRDNRSTSSVAESYQWFQHQKADKEEERFEWNMN